MFALSSLKCFYLDFCVVLNKRLDVPLAGEMTTGNVDNVLCPVLLDCEVCILLKPHFGQQPAL